MNQIKIISPLFFRVLFLYPGNVVGCTWPKSKLGFTVTVTSSAAQPARNNSVSVTSVIRRLPDEAASQYHLISKVCKCKRTLAMCRDKIIERRKIGVRLPEEKPVESRRSLSRARHADFEGMPPGLRKIAFVVDQRKSRRETSSKADKSGFAKPSAGNLETNDSDETRFRTMLPSKIKRSVTSIWAWKYWRLC